MRVQVTPPPADSHCPDTADQDLTDDEQVPDDQFAGLTEMEKQKLMMMQQQDGTPDPLSVFWSFLRCYTIYAMLCYIYIVLFYIVLLSIMHECSLY